MRHSHILSEDPDNGIRKEQIDPIFIWMHTVSNNYPLMFPERDAKLLLVCNG